MTDRPWKRSSTTLTLLKPDQAHPYPNACEWGFLSDYQSDLFLCIEQSDTCYRKWFRRVYLIEWSNNWGYSGGKKGKASSNVANIRTIRTRIPGHSRPRTQSGLPSSRSRLSIEELAGISVVTINCRNGTLYVVLDIPLIVKIEYTNYEMRPLPVQQPILGYRTGRACVRSNFACLTMEETGWTYMLITQVEHALCRKTIGYLLCPGMFPIYKMATCETCEAQLLLSPSLKTFRLCDIQVSYEHQTFWKVIPSLSAWI